MLNKTNICSV